VISEALAAALAQTVTGEDAEDEQKGKNAITIVAGAWAPTPKMMVFLHLAPSCRTLF